MRTIKQKGQFDCGIAAAAMLLNVSYGKASSLCRGIFSPMKGIDHDPLISLLRQNGLIVSGRKRGDCAKVKSLSFDALVHVWLEKSGSHWLVWDGKYRKFRDPSDGTEKFECRTHYLIGS